MMSTLVFLGAVTQFCAALHVDIYTDEEEDAGLSLYLVLDRDLVIIHYTNIKSAGPAK